YFFIQAEDGIRDRNVTGVQTCALPIYLLTRTWSIAGHRDYSGRMAALEYETRLASELSTDREMPPEEYAAKLSERRKSILPIIEGMSREARGRMLDQLLTSELSAQQNHLKAHSEYIAEMEMR